MALVRGGNLGQPFQFKTSAIDFPARRLPACEKGGRAGKSIKAWLFRLCGLVIQRLNQRLLFRSRYDTQSVKNIPNLIKLLITGVVLAGNRRLRG